MATATSSHGENRMCRTNPRTATATMAATTRAMMAGMVIALLCCWAVAFLIPACRRRRLPSIRITPALPLVPPPGTSGLSLTGPRRPRNSPEAHRRCTIPGSPGQGRPVRDGSSRPRGLLLHVVGEVGQRGAEPGGVVLRGDAVGDILGDDVDPRPRLHG